MNHQVDEQCLDEHYIAQASKGMATAAPAAPPATVTVTTRQPIWTESAGVAGVARHGCCCSFNLLFILFEFCSHSICYSMLMTFFFKHCAYRSCSSCKCIHPANAFMHHCAFIVHVTAGAAGPGAVAGGVHPALHVTAG